MLAFSGIKACLGKKVVKFGKDNFCLVSRIAWQGDFAEHGKKSAGQSLSGQNMPPLPPACSLDCCSIWQKGGSWKAHCVVHLELEGTLCVVHLVKIGEVG